MNMQEFLNKAGADQALAEKMSKATSPDEAYAIAREAGLTDSFDTFVDTMKKLSSAAGDLTEAEMDAVTGGSKVTEIISVNCSIIVVTGIGSMVSACST